MKKMNKHPAADAAGRGEGREGGTPEMKAESSGARAGPWALRPDPPWTDGPSGAGVSRPWAVWAAILSLVLTAFPAAADHPAFQSWSPEQPGCSSTHQVANATATCLDATVHTEAPTTGELAGINIDGGILFEARNACSAYGRVDAHIEVAGNTGHMHLHDGTTELGMLSYETSGDAGSIFCCMDTSEVCLKTQVEASAGSISRWTGTGTSMESVDVSTHQARWDYCQQHPNDIYCQVDPSGDALTRPYNCGDHYCTADDCSDAFLESPAAASPETETSNRCLVEGDDADLTVTIDRTDGTGQTCTIEVTCRTGYQVADAPEVLEEDAADYNSFPETAEYTYFQEDNTLDVDVKEAHRVNLCDDATIQVGECG